MGLFFAGADRAKFLIDGSEGEAGKRGFHAGLGFEKHPVEDGFNFGSDRTFLVRREGA